MNSLIHVTGRDQNLLRDCYDHAFLTIDQIRRRHFALVSKAAAHNRLGRLREAGLLVSQTVGTVIYQGTSQKIGVVYQITRKGIDALRASNPSVAFRDEALPFHTSTLTHDLTVTEVVTSLRHRFPDCHIRLGGLAILPTNTKRVPDAIVLVANGKPNVAIEVELTPKSNRRYGEIILQYRLSQFEVVLYLVPGKPLLDKIRHQITGIREIQGLPLPSTGKFYFGIVDELLRDPKLAPLTNGTTNLTLGKESRQT